MQLYTPPKSLIEIPQSDIKLIGQEHQPPNIQSNNQDETIIKIPENPELLSTVSSISKDNIDRIQVIENQNLSDQLLIGNSSKPTTVSQKDKDIQAIFGLGVQQKGNIMSELNLKIVGGTLLMRQRNRNIFNKKSNQ
ncbi:MAG: hypothetical protein EZS28_050650 [Streblomastix strix]|uniref:Uncharacterized protein n=1 Tax=Streblomastix strix TaxID=222440 RepID=A0A5J4T7R2_9EUKA|nr:MAG: hypothetical protein EZS28_050650 [Streblomastix strix]